MCDVAISIGREMWLWSPTQLRAGVVEAMTMVLSETSRLDPEPKAPTRYVSLDGMRGLAALAVALFHFNIYLMPHGYLAVDLFFVLSGFVLYRSYLPKVRAGLGTGRFMLQRFARLYPLFFLGLLLGVIVAILEIVQGDPQAPSISKLLKSIAFNGLMLPSPANVAYYPFNVPSWSLMFEIIANIVLIVLIFRMPRVALVAVCLVSAVGMAPIILENQSANIGALWGEHSIAFMRTAFSFTLGVLIASLPQHHLRPAGWIGLSCILATVVLLAMPVPREWFAFYDLTIIFCFSPLLVYLGTRFEPPAFAVPFAVFFGDVSYALYAVHWSFIEPIRDVVKALGLSPIPAAMLFLSTMVLASWIAVRWYDLPLRRKLTAMLLSDPHRTRAYRA